MLFCKLRRTRCTICFYGGLLLLCIIVLIKHKHKENTIVDNISSDEKYWFMSEGKIFPTPTNWTTDVNLYYDKNLGNDRIVEQLMFAIANSVSNNTSLEAEQNSTLELVSNVTSEHHDVLAIKTIGLDGWDRIPLGQEIFLKQNCPIDACHIIADKDKADLYVSKGNSHTPDKPPPNQLHMIYMLESPHHTAVISKTGVNFLTATYRHDSDIVTPYEKWVYYNQSVHSVHQAINYAAGKTRKVAWFVSNCSPRNNRGYYAQELSKYIDVHIFGQCGNLTCSRSNEEICFEMLSTHYKFYLSFENSNCRDYITEKFFVNGLRNRVLPIVMGAHPDDYKRAAPHNSYIHVDDFSSPKDLAKYLHKLDKNDDLYNEYFRWKGTGEFINTFFFCRLCAQAHYATHFPKKTSYEVGRWWANVHICTSQPWRETLDIFVPENYHTILNKK